MSKRSNLNQDTKILIEGIESRLKGAEKDEPIILQFIEAFLNNSRKIPYIPYKNNMKVAVARLEKLKKSGVNLWGIGVAKKEQRINTSINRIIRLFQTQITELENIKKGKFKKEGLPI